MEAEQIGPIEFKLPKSNNEIKVIGIGGSGSNAVSRLLEKKIKGVDLVICNTDAKALKNSDVPFKLLIGSQTTEGRGSGANPDLGEIAAIESQAIIKKMLGTKTKLVFLIGGMGGGTATGAMPIIAKIALEMNILTVGIVSMPFKFEGIERQDQALLGINRLKSFVDTLVIIDNNKLRDIYGVLGFKDGFSRSDEALSNTVRGITEVVTQNFTANIDLGEIKSMLSGSGIATMGYGIASGRKRATKAIKNALNLSFLRHTQITNSKNVLLFIVSGKEEITIDEIGVINDYIQKKSENDVNILMAIGEDESLDDAISVTIIATELDSILEKKTPTSKSAFQNIKLSSEYQLLDLLKVKKSKNQFYKKEALLIGFMAFIISIYLFALNNWQNVISFISIFIVLILVTIKLTDIFYKRQKSYNKLIKRVHDDLVLMRGLLGVHDDELYDDINLKNLIEDEPELSVKTVYHLEDFEKEEEHESDPVNSPISELLMERASVRRKKMKDFNYEFGKSRIDDIETIPPKRGKQNLSYDDSNQENEQISEKSTDDNDLPKK